MISRREALTGAAPALAMAATVQTAQAAEACAPSAGVITRAQYDRHISLYNAGDMAFTQYYADDVVMEAVPPLKGIAAFAQFLRDLHTYVSEHITVEYYVSDKTGAAAQFLGEFRCVRDMPLTAMSGLFGKAIKKGQVLRQRGIILYGVRGGKFTYIREAPPIIIQDWS